jgi:hypothetical protein
MSDRSKNLSAALIGIAALVGAASPALAAAPYLGTTSRLTVLSATPRTGGAVTCTDATVRGIVGSSGARSAVTWTRCKLGASSAIIAPLPSQFLTDFNRAYVGIAAAPCKRILTGTLAGVQLAPGVYCFAEAAALTGTLTLAGTSTGVWTFLIEGDLTGKDFSVVMAGGARACNVFWGPTGATTMTTSNLKGTVLAGKAITLTGGSFVGRALALRAVTLTGVAVTGCT